MNLAPLAQPELDLEEYNAHANTRRLVPTPRCILAPTVSLQAARSHAYGLCAVRIRPQVSNIMTVVPLVNAMYSPSHCMHGHASGRMAYATCSRFERDAPCPSCTYARCAMRCEAPGGVRMPGSMLSMDRCDALRASRRACSLPSC